MHLRSLLLRFVLFSLPKCCAHYDVVQIWTDEEPYSGLVDNLVIVNVITKELKPTRPTNLVPGGDIIWHILQECWRTNAGDRPTMRDVVQRLG